MTNSMTQHNRPLLTGRSLGFPIAIPESAETLEARLITAKSALSRIGPMLRDLEEQIKVINDEFEYWWRVNQQCEFKLAKIRKIPAGASGQRAPQSKELSAENILARMASMEQGARAKMIAELEEMLKEV